MALLSNVLYILPMILGRTFDARFDRVGIDIFPQSVVENVTVTPKPGSSSQYKITASGEAVRELLKISPDAALKIKCGKLDLKGTGSYLKDMSKMNKVVEILTSVTFTTEIVSMPSPPKPYQDWVSKNKDDLGTHYVHSIVYGGELLASIRFKANKEEDFNYVNSVVTGSFQGGEASSLVAEGRLEKLQESLKDKASMEILYYATVPLKGVPNTIEGLRSLVNNFGAHIKEINNGKGVPTRVELRDLAELEGAERGKFNANRVLADTLKDFEREFDDLRKTQNMIIEWYRSLPMTITKQQEKKINKLYKRVQKVLRPYYDCIGKLNIEGDESQLQEAKEAYKEGKLVALPGKFAKEFSKLTHDVVAAEKKIYGTGTGVYTHWGSKKCPLSPMMHQLDSGYIATTSNKGTGGGSEYICVPENPDYEEMQPKFGLDTSAILSGARYGMMDENPFTDPAVRYYFAKGMPCSLCHLTNRTLINVFSAEDECPEDWIYEYSGYLMAGSNLPGRHMCVDENPEANEDTSGEQQTHMAGIIQVSNIEGGLGKPPYVKSAAIRCIVCSK